MHTMPFIAVIDARAATAGRLRGARLDDPQVHAAVAAQPSRKRSEKATRSTGGATTCSPSRVTA